MKKSFVFGCVAALLAFSPTYSFARPIHHKPFHSRPYHLHHYKHYLHRMRPLHAALRRREPVRRDERFAALRLSRAKLGRVRVAAAERRPIGPRMERYQASYRAPHLASAGVGSVMRASYYDTGRRTADGERFNPGAFTAAHKTLPFGTRLRLTNERNGRSVTVRINDRGPFVPGRSLDVTKAAAVALGMIGSGTATLRVQRV